MVSCPANEVQPVYPRIACVVEVVRELYGMKSLES